MKITIKKSSSGSECSKKAGTLLLFSDKNKITGNRYTVGCCGKTRTTQTAGA
jgi:hypothetical protein